MLDESSGEEARTSIWTPVQLSQLPSGGELLLAAKSVCDEPELAAATVRELGSFCCVLETDPELLFSSDFSRPSTITSKFAIAFRKSVKE